MFTCALFNLTQRYETNRISSSALQTTNIYYTCAQCLGNKDLKVRLHPLFCRNTVWSRQINNRCRCQIIERNTFINAWRALRNLRFSVAWLTEPALCPRAQETATNKTEIWLCALSTAPHPVCSIPTGHWRAWQVRK